MKMNRMHTANRILALLLIALMVLSLAACGTKGGDKMDGMSSEPKNAEEAVAMHKELMAQEGLYRRMFAAQAARQLQGFLVARAGHGAGVDEIGVAVVGIRAADVAKGQKLLLHGLRFILIDLAAESVECEFHR